MSNLEIVKQESKSNLLATGPIPHEETKIGKCPWPLERGDRAGLPCDGKTFDGDVLCTGHAVVEARRKAKESQAKEINVQVKASNPDVPTIAIRPYLQPEVEPVVAQPAPNASIDEILVIMRNFSIAMVNLTELLKRH